MTKGDLIRQWADYSDDTILAVAGEHGQPVDIGEVEPGVYLKEDGHRGHYLQFNTDAEDDDDD